MNTTDKFNTKARTEFEEVKKSLTKELAQFPNAKLEQIITIKYDSIVDKVMIEDFGNDYKTIIENDLEIHDINRKLLESAMNSYIQPEIELHRKLLMIN